MKQHLHNFCLIQAISLTFLNINHPIQAQNIPIPDTSLPVNSEVQLNNQTSSVTAGTVAGNNLFHSFTQFNIDQGYKVDFVSPGGGIENILVRVTGNNPSNISGTLSTSGASNPNLFLINPQGILFGNNVSLQINGSFVTTTANAIVFGEQGFFSASNPNNPALLTVKPSAFIFNQTVAQGIENGSILNEGRLRVGRGKSLLLLGGDVTLNNGTITAPGGRVELGGLKETGSVGLTIDGQELRLSFPDDVERANVTLTTGVLVDTTAGGGGDIVINAGELKLLKSMLVTGIGIRSGSPGAQAGNIELNITGLITIEDGQIENSVDTPSLGDGGDILIKAEALNIYQGEIFTSTYSQGDAGDIFIQVDGSVLMDRGSIHTNPLPRNSTVSQGTRAGNGGIIDIKADTLALINSAQIYTTTSNRGTSGSINIDVNQLTLNDGSDILSNTLGAGEAGDINIQSTNLRVSEGSVISTSTRSNAQAGDIGIDVDKLMLVDGGQIVASTFSSGSAGNVFVNATDSVTISGSIDESGEGFSEQNDGFNSGLFVSVRGDQLAAAGNININTPLLLLNNQGTVSAETNAGEGGNISITSQDIRLRDDSLITASAGVSGNGGDITINTNTLVALQNSDIRATATQDRGGNINITTEGLFLSADSDIVADSERGGIDGVVEINRPESDPNDDAVSVPVEPVDLTELIATGCGASGGLAAKIPPSKFIITGRGGLPPQPSEVLRSDLSLADLGTPVRQELVARTIPVATKQVILEPTPIVEAQGWVTNSKGQVVLTASLPDATLEVPWLNPRCHNS